MYVQCSCITSERKVLISKLYYLSHLDHLHQWCSSNSTPLKWIMDHDRSHILCNDTPQLPVGARMHHRGKHWRAFRRYIGIISDMFACRRSAVLFPYCICLALGFCYLSSCQTFIHQVKTLTGREPRKAQCNNRSLVCKNPIIIKKICSASPRSQCHFTLCCSWWALGCCPSVIIVTLMVAGWKTASCPAEWHRDPSIIQFSAQQAVLPPQKSLGVLRFSLASLK